MNLSKEQRLKIFIGSMLPSWLDFVPMQKGSRDSVKTIRADLKPTHSSSYQPAPSSTTSGHQQEGNGEMVPRWLRVADKITLPLMFMAGLICILLTLKYDQHREQAYADRLQLLNTQLQNQSTQLKDQATKLSGYSDQNRQLNDKLLSDKAEFDSFQSQVSETQKGSLAKALAEAKRDADASRELLAKIQGVQASLDQKKQDLDTKLQLLNDQLVAAQKYAAAAGESAKSSAIAEGNAKADVVDAAKARDGCIEFINNGTSSIAEKNKTALEQSLKEALKKINETATAAAAAAAAPKAKG